MKTLVLVPDPTTAYGFGAVLGALPNLRTRVIAYGSATAAALPAGLDLYVYPIRDGSRLPSSFMDALIEHEQPDVILAPTGAVGVAAVPVLLLDIDPKLELDTVNTSDDNNKVGWVEAATGIAERRPLLLKAGLFSVDLVPQWFSSPGRLAADAAPALASRLTDLASLASRVAAFPPIPESAVIETTVDVIEIPVQEIPESAPPLAELAPIALPTSIEASKTSETPVLAEPSGLEVHEPMRYRGKNERGTAVVLTSLQGLDDLTPSELSHATVIAVPETLSWLTARMGIAQFICMAQEPRSNEAIAALSTARAVVVHSDHLAADPMAVRARARVPLVDLSRLGGPSLGWSDELDRGFFPIGGDQALALQWASWLGVQQLIVAGTAGLESRPGWAQFWKGAQELLHSRGIKIDLPQAQQLVGAGTFALDLDGSRNS